MEGESWHSIDLQPKNLKTAENFIFLEIHVGFLGISCIIYATTL